jgi:ribosomal protein S27AE
MILTRRVDNIVYRLKLPLLARRKTQAVLLFFSKIIYISIIYIVVIFSINLLKLQGGGYMDARTCPNCGTIWYSADYDNTWICEECGAEIPSSPVIIQLPAKKIVLGYTNTDRLT